MRKRGLRRWLFGRGSGRSDEEVEALRRDFQRRYQSFRLLLEANHRSLELMGHLDARLQSTRPFGMSWVRAICARIAARVWHMVRRLKELAPERYAELGQRFEDITTRISDLSAPRTEPEGGAPVLRLDEIAGDAYALVGGKLANLAEFRNRLGLPVPDGFVVTTRGQARFLEARWLREEIDQRMQIASEESADELNRVCGEIEALIMEADLPEDLAAEIAAHYRVLEAEHGPDVRLAVRSSALQEDVAGASFAGQFRTVLNVGRDALCDAYKEVIASQYGAAATLYRRERGP